MNKLCGWLKRTKIHPEMAVESVIVRDDSVRRVLKRNPSVVIRQSTEDVIRTGGALSSQVNAREEGSFEDPCRSIYERTKEPGAYLQYQKSISAGRC